MRITGLALVALAAACAARAAAPPEHPATPPAPCLETLTIEHSRSVLEEQRGVGPHAYDFQSKYGAETIDPATYTPVKVVEEDRIDGEPILWFTPDKTVAVVDAAWFTPLAAIDVTRLSEGEHEEIGRFLAPGKLDGRTLAKFLIAAGILRPYVHMSAELCLEREHHHGAAYELVVSGVHTYFTNERNDDPFRFVFHLAADGTMTVDGLKLK